MDDGLQMFYLFRGLCRIPSRLINFYYDINEDGFGTYGTINGFTNDFARVNIIGIRLGRPQDFVMGLAP